MNGRKPAEQKRASIAMRPQRSSWIALIALVLVLTFSPLALAAPDLVVTKTNSVAGSTPLASPSWTWTWQISNIGDAPIAYSGLELLYDYLPNTGISYSTPVVSQTGDFVGPVNCSITGSFDLQCTANVIVNPGGILTVSTVATATASGAYVNPRPGGLCYHGGFDSTPTDPNPSNNTCADTVLVVAPLADLSVVKSNDVAGQSFNGGSWTWTIAAANSAGAGAAANFGSGEIVLTDNLPNFGLSYGPVMVSTGGGTTGSLICSVLNSDLLCVAAGPVSLPPGGTFSVTIPATASADLVYANPRAGGVCTVDPGLLVPESTEANNSCASSVTSVSADMAITKTNDVSGSTTMSNPNWNWTLQSQNVGSVTKSYPAGGVIFTDNLPNANAVYGSPSVSLSGGVTGSILCSIDGSANLTCVASGAVTFPTGSSATVSIPVTATAAGSFVNPRAGGTCNVETFFSAPADVNTTNDLCSDTVSVLAALPNLTLVKTNDTGGQSVPGGSWNWTLLVANAAGAEPAAFSNGATILVDALPDTGISYGLPAVVTSGGTAGVVNCAITGFDLACTASGAVSIPGAGAISVTVPVTATAERVHANPRAGGVCAVDPGLVLLESSEADNFCANAVSTETADLVATKSNDVGGVTSFSTPSWTWTVQIRNAGVLPKTFASGAQVLFDSLPDANIAYGVPGVSSSGVTGALICSVAGFDLSCVASGALTFNAGATATVTITATASAAGTFANPRTGGNCATTSANGTPADRTLSNDVCADTVIVTPFGTAPTVAKMFSPSAISPGVLTTLSITFSNANAFAVTGLAFTDVYPPGLVNAANPLPVTTCGAGIATAVAGGGTLALSGGVLPANGTCSVSVQVVAAGEGSLVNVLPAGAVTSENAASSGGASSATLLVTAATTEIPALSPMALLALSFLLGITGWLIQRRA